MDTDDLKERLPGHGEDEDQAWNVVVLGAAIGAGIVTRSLLKAGWRRATGDEPPKNPAASSVGWGEALAWTAATGVAVGVARLLARRGAAAGWEKVKGEKAPA